MRWRHGGLGLLLCAVAGCGGGNEAQRPPKVLKAAKLEAFGSCEALEDYIEDTAVLQMRTQLESYKKGRNGWWGQPIPVMDGGPGAPPESAPPAGGPDNYTGTNNQVAGVNEADFVQNDGTRLFVLSGQKLYLTRTWPAEQMGLAASLTIEGWPREMFLDEKNRLVIFSHVYEQRPGFLGDVASMPIACMPMECGYMHGNTTKVTTVDVTDLAEPRVVDELYLPGRYDNARRVGSAVRLVLADDFRWPQQVRWYVPTESGWDDEDYEKAIDALIKENERHIRQQELEQWLPRGRRVGQDGTHEVGYECQDFYRATGSTRLGLVTVASLDLDGGARQQVGRTSIVAEPGEVYASAEALYIASRHWWWWPEPGQTDATYLHKFDTREPSRVVYAGSGTVDGYLLDQFSMDEHQGVLRVATTISEVLESADGEIWFPSRTYSRVTTLRAEAGRLVEVGRGPDLAQDERIQSARFIGDRGYVVTFRQVDPLFTFDLSDPAHPRKVGELKIPGFSSYLHPMDEGHLLGIGEYVPENGDWSQRAVKLSVYDVTDLANPRETHTRLVGTVYGWSEAAHEHKAFNWFPARKLLAIPFSDWLPGASGEAYWGSFVSELRVFRVDAAEGITPVGAVSLTDAYRTRGDSGWSWYWTPWVRRSVMADDYVYAISDVGVRAAHVSNLSSPVSTVFFEPGASSP